MKFDVYYGRLATFFRVLCWFATLTAICYWLFIYSLNEDVCIIDNKKYYEHPSYVFPVLSVCFRNPFSTTQFQNETQEFNETEYIEFLKGDYFSKRLMEIDYHRIRLNISDYIDSYYIEWTNGTTRTHNYTEKPIKIFNQSFAGFWQRLRFYNCFALQTEPNINVTQFSVHFRNSLFPSSVKKQNHLVALLHYPNQLFMGYKTIKYWSTTKEANSSYSMRFLVKGAEVLQRRNKIFSPCIDGRHNYDEIIIQNNLNSVGCKPPYVGNHISKLPVCSNQENITRAMVVLKSGDYGSWPPCRSMEKIDYTYNEGTLKDTEWWNPGTFWINFSIFNPHFKEILQTR